MGRYEKPSFSASVLDAIEKSDLVRTPATYFYCGFEKSYRKLKSESEPVFVRPKPVRTGKPKQHISPGGRIAGFLNSIFTAAGNAKKRMKLSSYTQSCLPFIFDNLEAIGIDREE